MNLLPINENEAILEAYWNGDKNGDDSRLDILAPYHIKWPHGASGIIRQSAYFTISTPAKNGPSLIMERNCDVNLNGYDQFILSASMPAGVNVRLLACLDEVWQTIIHDQSGIDSYEEYIGNFTGNHLTGLRFEFTVVGTTPAVITLSWLMVVNHCGVKNMLSRQTVYDESWPGLLAPDSKISNPQLELFFNSAELNKLREKVQLPHLKHHYDALLNRAQELLNIKPEDYIGSYAPGGNIARGCRKRDLNKPWLGAGVSDLLAFAGIMENDSQFSRHAARMALALAHCDHWIHSFIGSLSGTTSHPRSFSESYMLRPLPLVLDWAGNLLNPAGRELIRDAMITKGLARIESDFRRWEYIRGMNQGLLFTPGRINAYLALEKTYPRYRINLLEAERDMRSILNHYLQSDGGTLEGMGYWHSIGEVFPTMFALARRHNKTLHDVIGDRIRHTANYALEMLSSAGSGTEFLTINAAGQGHLQPSLMMTAVLAEVADNDRLRQLYAKLAMDASPEVDWFHLLIAPTEIKSVTSMSTSEASSFYYFPSTGHTGIRRHSDNIGIIRFHLFSGPSRGGHSHQDKGSFIIEAAGETLALDRGTTNYDNPAHLLMGKAGWHNLTVPETSDGRPMEQQPLTTPGGRIQYAEFENDILNINCDNRQAWVPGLFSRNQRRVWSPSAELFILVDNLILHEPHAVSFRLNSLFPIILDNDNSWRVKGLHNQLRIVPVNWQPEMNDVNIEGIDSHGLPVSLLKMATKPAKHHQLVTLIEVMPISSSPQWSYHWIKESNSLELKNISSRNPNNSIGPIDLFKTKLRRKK